MEGSGIGQFIPLILIFVIFIFLSDQQRKLKSIKLWWKFKKGDKVITSEV